MLPRKSGLAAAAVLVALLTLGAPRLHAQDDDDADGPSDSATLQLRFNAEGDATATLYLATNPKSPEDMRRAMGEMLSCPANRFSSPISRDIGRYRGSMSDKQWERYQRSLQAVADRQLEGTCTGVLVADQWLRRGRIQFAPLARSLVDSGITSLAVSILYPATAFQEIGGDTAGRWKIERRYASATFDLDQQRIPGDASVAFGFRPRDLRRAGLIALGFVLAPILVIFWMQRVTLAAGDDDRVAAWFSYHRTSNWCVTATILLWIFSDLGARQTFERYLGFRLGDSSILVPIVSAALMFVPILLVYATSVALAYPVFVYLRKTEWRRREYLLVQLLQGGVTLLPLMFIMAGIMLLWNYRQVAIGSFIAAYASYVACSTWKMRIARTFPEALTTGELRDKVFELARKAAVPVRQVFVLPAGKGQIANAAAAKNNIVLFTDYLLQKLSKREVNYVAAHELTHLQKRHPAKLQFALLAAILAPTWVPWLAQTAFGLALAGITGLRAANLAPAVMRWERFWTSFQGWMFHDLVLIVAGFTGFYLLARRFEFAADAGAIALTGDPEAAISGLLKTNRLNLMPLQWGKVSGAWLTHPTTLHRVEQMAALGSVSRDRLHQLLQRAGAGAADELEEEHYPLPSAPENAVVSFSGQTSRVRFNLWVLVMFHWLPAAATALLVDARHWHGETRMLAYVAGLAVTLGFYLLVMRWLGIRGRADIERPLWAKVRRDGIAPEQFGAQSVGLSPGATPRFYVSSYNWDTGLLLFSQHRLYFLGNQLRFALTQDQVLDVRLGPGAPSWFRMPRVYLLWRDAETGREGSFNLASAAPCRAADLAKQSQELQQQLSKWKQGAMSAGPIATLSGLASPVLGEVTSMSPKALTSPGKSLKTLLFLILPVAIAGCILLRVQAIGYVCFATLIVRLFEMIPHWRYKERAVYPPQAAQPLAATAAAGPSR